MNYSNETEKEIIKFWEDNKIRQKFLSEKSKKKFYFMDGPPYATGHIHMGTALNKTLKDVAIKSKKLQGYQIFTRPGYDTHGLPIENKVEQKLGFESKQDIVDYGVEKFVKECKNFATEFIDSMNAEFLDLGVWMDWENPYITLKNEYIEAIWFTFKKAFEKKLLYQGLYSVHVCTHCETAVAYNEIEYSKVTENSVFVKFPVKGKKNTFLVIWTTTPWTLPANLAVMVHPKYEYAFVKTGNETLVIAEALAESVMKKAGLKFSIEKTISGKDLEGLEYENPLEKHLARPKFENANKVILHDRFVGLEDGTGLVHCAPGHGKEDFEAGAQYDIKPFCPVDLNGVMNKDAGKYSGMKAKKIADKAIIDDLKAGSHLLFELQYTHDYPFCWRCKNPLLMLATKQWFFNIKQIREKLLEENENTNWNPKWMKDRMKNWMQSLGDWPVSRQRFWGSPLPIWLCSNCPKQEVFGSLKELKERSSLKKDIELHKPFIDAVNFPCTCGKGTMTRVPEVLDVWFDSGVSSWGALDYSQNKELFKEFWPADLNLEGTDQVRGWWNSQFICSEIAFNKKPFKDIMAHGMVLDIKKRKMSKSLGNIVSPKEVIEKYNRDYLRYYLTKQSKGSDVLFDFDALKDVHTTFNIFFNVFNFAEMYFTDFKLSDKAPSLELLPEDKWILSRLFSLSENMIESYNEYSFFKAINYFEEFLMEDFSRTYIKLVRKRFDSDTSKPLKETLSFIFSSLLKLVAPITPHVSEYLFQKYKDKKMEESILLSQFTVVPKSLENKELAEGMNAVKKITEETLALRNKEKLRLRWLLNELIIIVPEGIKLDSLEEILAKQCNVKNVRVEKKFTSANHSESEKDGIKLFLDLNASSELKKQWEVQELIRKIQEERKLKKFNPSDKKELFVDSDDKRFLEEFKELIERETNSFISVKNLPDKEKLIERSFSVSFK